MEKKKTDNNYYSAHISQDLTRAVLAALKGCHFMITITSLPETLQVLINHFLSQHWLVLKDILEVDMYVVSRGDLVQRFSR